MHEHHLTVLLKLPSDLFRIRCMTHGAALRTGKKYENKTAEYCRVYLNPHDTVHSLDALYLYIYNTKK